MYVNYIHIIKIAIITVTIRINFLSTVRAGFYAHGIIMIIPAPTTRD